MKSITSRHNALIKQIATLHDHQARMQQRLFIAEGIRTCATLLESPIKLAYLFYTQSTKKNHHPAYYEQSYIVTDDVMQKISATISPSGVIGVFHIPDTTPPDKLVQPGLVLAHITNPGNMGTLMRTACAVGISSIIVLDGCDPWSPKVVQATAGTIGHVQIYDMTIDTFVQAVGKRASLCALVVSGGKPIQDVTLQDSFLIIGNEARGIPDELLRHCKTQVTLPMPGNAESLNAAIAGCIALYIGYVYKV